MTSTDAVIMSHSMRFWFDGCLHGGENVNSQTENNKQLMNTLTSHDDAEAVAWTELLIPKSVTVITHTHTHRALST